MPHEKTYRVLGCTNPALHNEHIIASGLSTRAAADRVIEAAVARGYVFLRVEAED